MTDSIVVTKAKNPWTKLSTGDATFGDSIIPAPGIMKYDEDDKVGITSVDLESKTITFKTPDKIPVHITQDGDLPALKIDQNSNTSAIVIKQKGVEYHSEIDGDQLTFKKFCEDDPWVSDSLIDGNKIFLQTGQFTSTMKTTGSVTSTTNTNLQWNEDFGQTAAQIETDAGKPRIYTFPQEVDPNHKTLEEAFDFSNEDWDETDEEKKRFEAWWYDNPQPGSVSQRTAKMVYNIYLDNLATKKAADEAKSRMVGKSLAEHDLKFPNALVNQDILKASTKAFVEKEDRCPTEDDEDPTGNNWGYEQRLDRSKRNGCFTPFFTDPWKPVHEKAPQYNVSTTDESDWGAEVSDYLETFETDLKTISFKPSFWQRIKKIIW